MQQEQGKSEAVVWCGDVGEKRPLIKSGTISKGNEIRLENEKLPQPLVPNS